MMELCIHRGAKQIGGSCVEVAVQDKRLVIDLGLPLDAELDEVDLPQVKGLNQYHPSLLGIIISHIHLDHYGLAVKADPNIPIFIGADCRRILDAVRIFFPGTWDVSSNVSLENGKPIYLEPFTITPFLVDHSAYDAYAILIEAEGKRIFYSGDFRAHGRKHKLYEKLIKNPPQNIDVLLMEGSTIGRSGIENAYPTEEELENRFKEIFIKSKGLTLIWTAGQNIDRLVTIYKACRKMNKKFIADLYTANILRSIGNKRLPQPGWEDFYVYVPNNQRIIIKQRELFDFVRQFSSCRIYPDRMKAFGDQAVLLFRPSMVKEIGATGLLENANLIYSLWPGYLKDERLQWFKKWMDSNKIAMEYCHTSGHASVEDLQRFARALSPRKLIPIHSYEVDQYNELFGNVEVHNDGERWTV